jgi:hypothetical protein
MVAAAIEKQGSLIDAIEALRDKGRSLRQLGVTAEDEWSAVLADQPMIDPAEPVDVDSLLSDVVARSERTPASGRIVAIALILFALSALALAWRYTPLHEWINVESLVRLSDRFEASPFAPLIVIGGFVLGGLLVMPVMMLIAATGIVFGPWLGMLYSLLGATLSAVFVYGIGREVGRDAVRRVAGRRINDLSRRIAKRGLLACCSCASCRWRLFRLSTWWPEHRTCAFATFCSARSWAFAGNDLISFSSTASLRRVRHPGGDICAAGAGRGCRDRRHAGGSRPPQAQRCCRRARIRPRHAPTDRAMASSTLTVATYNIHDAVGGDGNSRPSASSPCSPRSTRTSSRCRKSARTMTASTRWSGCATPRAERRLRARALARRRRTAITCRRGTRSSDTHSI